MSYDEKPAAYVIDDIRRQYAAKQTDRASAILHIQSLVSVTERGAADLLDAPQSAVARYGRLR